MRTRAVILLAPIAAVVAIAASAAMPVLAAPPAPAAMNSTASAAATTDASAVRVSPASRAPAARRVAAAASVATPVMATASILAPVSVSVAALPTVPVTVDLTSESGAALVQATWKYSDAHIVEVPFRAADAEGQPTGAPVSTYDIAPQAGAADFDDSAWAVIAPGSLASRRGKGRVSFNWYRLDVTVPERIGTFDPAGSTVWFETRLDDYAEVWVDGEIGRAFGQSGGSVVAGWNAPNRLIVARNAKPGQHIHVAVFGMNGPISNAPTNYIYVREAKLDFTAGPRGPVAAPPHEVNIKVERLDPAVDQIVPPNAKLFKLAEGFEFTEGPIWLRGSESSEGRLLFSDPNHNTIYQYTESGVLSVFRDHSGYDAADIAEYGQPGSNGLTLDREGRLTINEHGRHRVSRLEKDGTVTVLAANYTGKRLNSPNDLVYRSDGSLYFTDPPFGLPKFYDDPRKELPYSGVYRWSGGKLQLLSKDLKGPNGIVFSPDEKFLYVGNWDPAAKTVTRYPVRKDGSVGQGTVFIDLTAQVPGEEALDGIKVDVRGNLYLSAPGGVWIFNASGKHLGTITAPKPVHNFAWGGADGKTLYLCARSALYRVPLLVEGVRP
jgi:gluconolactonase